MNVDNKLEEFLKPLFGDMATMTIETQKEKLGISGPDLTQDQYMDLAEEIKELCEDMAGTLMAQKIYEGLIAIVTEDP